MTDETRQVISDYLAGCRTKHSKYADAQARIVGMTFGAKPEVQWNVILEMMRQATDDDLGHIAAGPIEGLLGWHGPAWIDRVEAEAKQDPKFARAVTGVRKYLMKDDVWERVKLIKERVPRERWLPAGLTELTKRSAK